MLDTLGRSDESRIFYLRFRVFLDDLGPFLNQALHRFTLHPFRRSLQLFKDLVQSLYVTFGLLKMLLKSGF